MIPWTEATTTNIEAILHFEGEQIRHVQKVWNDHVMMKQVGWV